MTIDTLTSVAIGGIDQWIRIRSADPARPVLLVLYGGPGFPVFPRVEDLGRTAGLEETYTVVYWEQRGTGKSVAASPSPESMTIDRFVQDVLELSEHLRSRFDKDRIVLLGISWGTLLGIRAIAKSPDQFWAYVGSGQIVNGLEGDRRSYEFTLSEAKQRDHRKALRDLVTIGSPPFTVKELLTQRKWAGKFGGIRHGNTPQGPMAMLSDLLTTSAYSWTDLWNVASDPFFCLRHLVDEIYEQNLEEQVPKLSCPVYLLQGQHDAVTPPGLAKSYYGSLNAPTKEWYWFDRSAHFPFLDEPSKFGKVLKAITPESDPSDGGTVG